MLLPNAGDNVRLSVDPLRSPILQECCTMKNFYCMHCFTTTVGKQPWRAHPEWMEAFARDHSAEAHWKVHRQLWWPLMNSSQLP